MTSLDLVVMGQVMAGCFSGETSSHRRQERGKTLHHVSPQWHEDLPEDLPVPAHHGLWALQSHQGQLQDKWSSSQGPRQQGEAKEDRTVTEADSGHRTVHHELCWCV